MSESLPEPVVVVSEGARWPLFPRFRIPPPWEEEVRVICERNGISKATLGRLALKEFIVKRREP